MKQLSLAVTLAAALMAGLAQAETTVKMAGGMLTDQAGMTLYTFDKDSAGKSACNGPCATLWPPALAPADAKADGDLSLVTRDDGAKQWAFKGKPLYLYSKDSKAGEMSGDKFKDVWHTAK